MMTDEDIALCIFEARLEHNPFKRDGSTSFRIARVVERKAIAELARLTNALIGQLEADKDYGCEVDAIREYLGRMK